MNEQVKIGIDVGGTLTKVALIRNQFNNLKGLEKFNKIAQVRKKIKMRG
jgi:activator of 2-hydroxyglutaryl-CoA dehydratase